MKLIGILGGENGYADYPASRIAGSGTHQDIAGVVTAM
jgi:hypothetical protein